MLKVELNTSILYFDDLSKQNFKLTINDKTYDTKQVLELLLNAVNRETNLTLQYAEEIMKRQYRLKFIGRDYSYASYRLKLEAAIKKDGINLNKTNIDIYAIYKKLQAKYRKRIQRAEVGNKILKFFSKNQEPFYVNGRTLYEILSYYDIKLSNVEELKMLQKIINEVSTDKLNESVANSLCLAVSR